MFDQIGRYQQYIQRITDIRVLGQVVFVVIVLLVSWSSVKVIHTNYKLQQQVARIQQENEIQKLKNENQRLRNQYYNSDQYLELAARQNFGLAAPGEKELLVPKEVALAHVPEQGVAARRTEGAGLAGKQPFYQRNLQAWLNFFLHRSPPVD